MKAPHLTFNEITLLAISTLTVLAGATIAPSLPYIAEQFSQLTHNTFWAQFAIGLPGICVAISAAWIGKKAAGKNTPRLLIAALIGYGILGVAYLVAPAQLALLLTSRAALGFCVAAIMILTTVLLIKGKDPQKSGQLLGYQAAAGGFGGVLYMALANELTQWYGLAPFGLYAIAWAFAMLLWISLANDSQPAPKTQPPNTNSLTTDTGNNKPTVSTPGFILFGAFATIEMLALYALVLQIPMLKVATPYALSAGLTCMLLAMSIIAACYGRTQQLLSKQGQHALGLFLVTAGFTALASEVANLHITGLLITLCVMGIGLGLLRPNLVAWVFSTIPVSARHSVMGKLTAIFFTAQFIAPFIVYPLTRFVGVQLMWLFFASICGLAFTYLVMLSKPNSSRSPEPIKG